MPPCDVLSICYRALAAGAAQATAEATAATVDIESQRVKMRINLLDADVEYKRTVIATLERTVKEKEAGADNNGESIGVIHHMVHRRSPRHPPQ